MILLRTFHALRPAGGFDLIMADPPWHYEMRSERGEAKCPQAHYRTMSIADIKALPVEALAARDCLLWLWAVGPMLPEALEVVAVTRSTRNVIFGVAREHSRKPEEAFQAAERLMPEAKRLEMFSRQRRSGWKVWGLEIDKFEGAA